MSAPARSASPRARRALHERTPSHTNERSPSRSLRIVPDEEVDMYTATPFPTKPEQILPPLPGKGQQRYISDTGFSYSDHHLGPSTYSSTTWSQGSPKSPREHSIGESWDVSSTVDTGNSPPQMWDDDPSSSKSSLPELASGKAPNYGLESSEPEFSDDEMIVMPTATPTIKAVLSDPPTSPKSSAETDSEGCSSPNLEQIGAPSSPNFVLLDNSSMNFPRPPTASSESEQRTNSLSSYQSRGTVVRHAGAGPWFQSMFQPASSDQSSYQSPSFHSSPPTQSVASFRSSSRVPSGNHSRSATASSRSLRSASDLQAAIDNGVPVQYPRIRAPSSSSSRADMSVSSERDFTPGPASGRCNPHLASGRWPSSSSSQADASASEREFASGPASGRTNPHLASGRWNPHLSTVSSIWSTDESTKLPGEANTDSDREMAEPTLPPPAALQTETTRSSVWLVESSNDSEDERLDSLTKLPSRPIFTQSLSSGSKRSDSRSNSTRSLQRPGTGSSTIFNILPTWAKVYYLREPMGLNSTLSMIDASRPSSARPGTSNSSVFNLVPGPLNVPRPRSPDRPQSPEHHISKPHPKLPKRRLESDPRDPRAHWVPSPQPEDGEVTGSHLHRLRHSWSPHLMQDRRVVQHSSSRWRAPSLDSRNEPIFGRRNIQVYSFCFGFICPLAWCIAGFLPLPPKPKMTQEMLEYESDSEVEMALEAQCMNLQQRRHDNARWWRNLNRWMISLGVVIVVIIVTLAAIGTTTGF